MNKYILVDNTGPVVRLTINRPEVRNAINDGVCEELADGIRQAQASPTARAIVITGAGDRAFCAGGDLKPTSGAFGQDYSRPMSRYGELLALAANCDLPLIARVNGHCLAGGMGLLAMCDMAVAAEGYKFGLPETRIGMFAMQVASLMRHQVPARQFAEMCITGEPITTEDALRWNLINYAVPAAELDAKVDWLLDRVVRSSPTAIRRGKHALRMIQDMTNAQAISYMSAQLATMTFTEDSKEGIASFNEKRTPEWTGR